MADSPTLSSTPPSGDRRSSPRFAVEVELGVHSESNFFTGLSMDLSDGGLFVATHAPLPIGSEVTVKFALPGTPEMSIDAEVMWQRDPVEGAPGMGVRFIALDDESKQTIVRFIAKREPMLYDL